MKDVLWEVPEGWKVLDGAVSHPRGLRWISNGKPRFSAEYQTALVMEDAAIEWCKANRRRSSEEITGTCTASTDC